MSKLEKLEREVEELTPEERAAFREWFAAFDAAAWDADLERHANSGRLDRVAEDALADYRAGRTRPI
jgi:hypothetical protein